MIPLNLSCWLAGNWKFLVNPTSFFRKTWYVSVCSLLNASFLKSGFTTSKLMRFWSSESLPWTLSQLLVAAIRSGNIPESAILAESQVVREAIRIPGSGIRLVYHSSRAKGFYSTIQLQLTPATVPQSLLRVHLQITIEGRPACYSISVGLLIGYYLLGRGTGPGSFTGSSAGKKTGFRIRIDLMRIRIRIRIQHFF